jgi:hypothetical protein
MSRQGHGRSIEAPKRRRRIKGFRDRETDQALMATLSDAILLKPLRTATSSPSLPADGTL